MKELDNDEMDLFFVSAYYYGNEYSFYENQVSLTFLAPRDAHWDRRKIIVIRSNGSNSVLEPMKVHRATPHNICKFVTITGTVTLKDDLMDLEILVNKNIAGIRYLPADKKQRDLVVCTPPIYNNVRWQSILLIAHIYARFPRFPIEQNLNQCDNSSASFIAFLEWDEFLIPTRFSSFFDEFANFFESEIFVGLLEYKNSKGVSKIVSRPFNIGSIWLNEPVERPYKLKTKKMGQNTSKIYEVDESVDLDSMTRGKFPGAKDLKSSDRQAIARDIKKYRYPL
ncbi:hypothetical protein L5515_000137 [Caenorhabditis briggsae]|uniref:Glycosyltransferase family 92 protein n=1 Tax=Caenorhabditis briggsae TaxID=6238 RepID=A0AAE9E0U7_CAEBR|nr:hypothetical protein L5515_000137 [Caenorhabditis briggsae]